MLLWQYQRQSEPLHREGGQTPQGAPVTAGAVLPRSFLFLYQSLAWVHVTVAADVDWLPCVWMQEGIDETMVASGTTAYQEQEADFLRLNGDPITVNGDPIRVVI